MLNKRVKQFLALSIFLLLMTHCASKKSGSELDQALFLNHENNSVIITNEAFKNQVPEEDIEYFRSIQREIALQYPLKKSVLTKQTGINPSQEQIIEAFRAAYQKYNIPVEILYGIAKQESGLMQFRSNGQPVISGDDGIGIMQVTPGAVDIQFDRYSLMWDYKYNINAGAQVVLSKWRYANGRNPIGDSNYKVLENWYFTLWAYNGFATVNNPNEYKNGPRQWCNSSICWTRTKPYQLVAYDMIQAKFGVSITPIPAYLLPSSGIPAQGRSFQTPTPIHWTESQGSNAEDFKPGLISREYSTGNLYFYPGDGKGGFLSRKQIGHGWNGMDYIFGTGDFNGDGHNDFIARQATSHNLMLYSANGAGGFSEAIQIGINWSAFNVILGPGDWNGDGKTDIIARNASNHNLYLYPGDGTGKFYTPVQIGNGWGGFDIIIAAGDWDGDGKADLITRNTSNKNLYLYPGNGTGGFGIPRQIGVNWSAFDKIIGVGDFNGDGKPDLIAKESSTGNLVLYPGNGSGGFLASKLIGHGWNSMDFILSITVK